MYETFFDQLREQNPAIAAPREVEALLTFLNGQSSADEAARDYTSLVAQADDPDPTNIWNLVEQTATHAVDPQPRLVELLQAIQRLPGIVRDGEAVEDLGERYWSELPTLAFDLREMWDGLLSAIKNNGDTSGRTEFINLTSFHARLLAHGVFPLEHWAAMTCRLALETEHPDQVQLADTLVPAAAQWILHAGEQVYRCEDEMLVPDRHENFTFAGPLWKGKQGLSKERWAFWKERFQAMERVSGIQLSTKEGAAQAAARMEEIERESSREAQHQY